MAWPPARIVRLLAVLAIMPTAVWAGFALTHAKIKPSIAHGPLIAAHADVACAACHLKTPGTVRQQVQAQVRYVLGLRQTPVDFGYAEVGSEQCLACHARPNERHPIYRFREPRFAKAIVQVDARSCLGCHSEHVPQIVTVAPTLCQACHEDLNVKNDPVDTSHERLVSLEKWGSCLGCHDFHGNHHLKPPTRMVEVLPAAEIWGYFQGGDDPFGGTKLYEGKAP
ncbi:cytochrome c3 family protein [Shimia sagamensis]|uniref:Cytochrome c3 n=1 Tax=Shimia sagamensis TaxID=1566352 RepID=A0ABY1P1A9_9RHOB|nr:cytochrome c3 family protein [Shimia sagamensis]SMP23861.1 Cytochrome c3 [Shimia sagamensis]